jgi:hypothetical protein
MPALPALSSSLYVGEPTSTVVAFKLSKSQYRE